MEEDLFRAGVMITEEKWDVFSGRMRVAQDLDEWRDWFLSRGKEAKIQEFPATTPSGEKYYVLYVKQRWYVRKEEAEG